METANGDYKKYKETDQTQKSKVGKSTLLGFKKIIASNNEHLEDLQKRVEAIPTVWSEHTWQFKDQWWRYTGEMGWSIKNIQTTGMDLGWFS